MMFLTSFAPLKKALGLHAPPHTKRFAGFYGGPIVSGAPGIKKIEDMKKEMIKIEGIATISKRGFSFDSGLPQNEPLLEYEQKLHGQMLIHQNGCAEFVDNGRVYLPPVINEIARGENYSLRRTTRHYILQVKVPVVESREESEQTFGELMPLIMNEITLDRKELLYL